MDINDDAAPKQFLVQLANNSGFFLLSTAPSAESAAAEEVADATADNLSNPVGRPRLNVAEKLHRKETTRRKNLPKLQVILDVNPFQFPQGSQRNDAWDRVLSVLSEKGLAKRTEKELRNAQLCAYRATKEYAAKLNIEGVDSDCPPVSDDEFEAVVRKLYLADSKNKRITRRKREKNAGKNEKERERKRSKRVPEESNSGADDENVADSEYPLDANYCPLPGSDEAEEEDFKMDVGEKESYDQAGYDEDENDGSEGDLPEPESRETTPVASSDPPGILNTDAAVITAQAGSSFVYILRTTDPQTGQTRLQAVSTAPAGPAPAGAPFGALIGTANRPLLLKPPASVDPVAANSQQTSVRKLPIARHPPKYVAEPVKPMIQAFQPIPVVSSPGPVQQRPAAVASRTRLATAKYVVVKQIAPIRVPKEAFQKKPDVDSETAKEPTLCKYYHKREEAANRLQAVVDAGVFTHKNNSRAKGEAWKDAVRLAKAKVPSLKSKSAGHALHALETSVNNYLNRIKRMIKYGEIAEDQVFTSDVERLAKNIYDTQKATESRWMNEQSPAVENMDEGTAMETADGEVEDAEEPRNEMDWRTGLFWCKECSLCLDEPCLTHSNTVDDRVFLPRALATLPSCLCIDTSASRTRWTVTTKSRIAAQTCFGPLTAPRRAAPDSDEIRYSIQTTDGSLAHFRLTDDNLCNWMKYVNLARNPQEQNLAAYCQDGNVYFATTRSVAVEEELRVWYSRSYGTVMGKSMLAGETQVVLERTVSTRKKTTGLTREKDSVPVDELSVDIDDRSVDMGEPLADTDPLPMDTDWSPADPVGRNSDSDYEPKTAPRKSPSKKQKKSHKKKNPVGRPKGSVRKQRNPWTRMMPGIRRAKAMAKQAPKEPAMKRPSVPLYKKKCTKCGAIFRVESALKIHELSHEENLDDDGTVEKKCPVCFLEVDTLVQLIDHVERHSKKPSIYKKVTDFPCPQCKFQFASQKNLDIHVRRMHTESAVVERVFECDVCHEKLLTKAGLVSHVKIHQDKKYFECPVCLLSFNFGYQLQDHSESHCVDGRFPCRLCDGSYDNFGQLKRHLRIIHLPKNVPCEICGETFKNAGRLTKHKIVHSNEYSFECEICGKKYKAHGNLKQHLRLCHRPNKVDRRKVPREDGAPSSTRKGYVPPRQRMLYEDFPYKCEECRTGFLRRGMLTTHLRAYHPEIPLDIVPEHVERTFEALC